MLKEGRRAMPMALMVFGVKPILSAPFAWAFMADCTLALSLVSIVFAFSVWQFLFKNYNRSL
jgi:hypothetical protein